MLLLVKLCNHRQYMCRNKEGYCWLELDNLHEEPLKEIRMFGGDGERTYERIVFTFDGRTDGTLTFQNIDGKWVESYDRERLWCDDEMSKVCTFRFHKPWPRYELGAEKLTDCEYCGNRHYGNNQARKFCEEWHKALKIFNEMYLKGEKWSVHGSREDPFKGRLNDTYRQYLWQWIRAEILKRDNYTCQMCGRNRDNSNFGEKGQSSKECWVVGSYIIRKDGDWDENDKYKEFTVPIKPEEDHPDLYLSLEVHHIIFRENGGSDHPRNLMTTCNFCHHWWHSKHGGGGRNMAKKEQRNKHLEEWN